MPTELINALIAAGVVLLTASITGVITWSQIQRERKKWLIDLKTAYSVLIRMMLKQKMGR